MILTIDLGTSVTKVVVWTDTGPLAIGRSALECNYRAGNRAEQDPRSWWPSVVAACTAARSAARDASGITGGDGDDGADGGELFGAVRAIGFSAARQTFVPVTADGAPLGPALLWSDRRASTEAVVLAGSFGDDGADIVRRRTGVVLDAGSLAAKVAWLERHEPDRLGAARWLLAPRDLVAWHLTGEVCTDVTLASATGLFELSGDAATDLGPVVPGLVDSVVDLLPEARPSDSVTGALLAGPAAELGLPAGIPVVIGAGDRACEVLGAAASETWPMVSWGTTANVSVPVSEVGRVDPAPQSMIVTRGARGGWLLEGGLSAAGSLVEWLARLTGLDTASLMDRARSSPPGSGGVMALPWLGGARAPWWRDRARGAVLGLSFDHDAGDVARAVVESVAFDVARCLESATAAQGLVLGGGGAHLVLWTEILTAVTGLRARRRRSGEAASAGAALLVASATGADFELDRLDPVDTEITPPASASAAYAALRPTVDAAAAAVVALEPGPQLELGR